MRGLVCIAVLGFAIQATAQPADVQPAQTHYLGREIAQTMHYTGAPWLVR